MPCGAGLDLRQRLSAFAPACVDPSQAAKPGQAAWGPVRKAAVLILKARAQAATGDLTAADATMQAALSAPRDAASEPSASGRSGGSLGAGATASPSGSAAGDGLTEGLAQFAAHLNCCPPLSLSVDVAALSAALKAADAAKARGNDAFKAGKLSDARKAYGEAVKRDPLMVGMFHVPRQRLCPLLTPRLTLQRRRLDSGPPALRSTATSQSRARRWWVDNCRLDACQHPLAHPLAHTRHRF